jgi:large subunit ribosomal protein L9
VLVIGLQAVGCCGSRFELFAILVYHYNRLRIESGDAMKILLTQDVENLGRAGDIKVVAGGYARNFLIPKGLAVLATEGAIQQARLQSKAEAKRQRRAGEEAASLAEILWQLTLTFKAKAGEKDRLYGSITNSDIAEALERETGYAFDKRKVQLVGPIRELGVHQVPIKLMTDVTPEITVVVEREE